jgi:hypothetical protein
VAIMHIAHSFIKIFALIGEHGKRFNQCGRGAPRLMTCFLPRGPHACDTAQVRRTIACASRADAR